MPMLIPQFTEEDPTTLGTTQGDELFRKGSKIQFPIVSASKAKSDISSSSSNSNSNSNSNNNSSSSSSSDSSDEG